jgi:serine phosphatase RsbU (regulator of sigma subunit)
MVERVNETLWSASTGDQFASLFYGVLQPDTGDFEYAAAGQIHAQLVGEACRPLTVQLDLPLGSQPDAYYPSHRDRLERGEVLVVCSEGLTRDLNAGRRRNLWRLIHRHQAEPVDDLLAKIQDFVRRPEDDEHNDQTLLIVKRHAAA